MGLNLEGQNVAFTGADELLAVLKQLPKAAPRRVLTAGLRAAARPIVADAKARVAKRSGRLARGIVARVVRTRGGPATVKIRIGPRREVFYGMFQEFGTRFQAARPWLRPAFDTNRALAFDRMKDFIGRAVLREATRIAGPFRQSGLRTRRRWRQRARARRR